MVQEAEFIGAVMFPAGFLIEGGPMTERAVRGQAVGVSGNLENNEGNQRDQCILHPSLLLGLLVFVTAINQPTNSRPAKQVVGHTQQQSSDIVKWARLLTQLPIACPAGELLVILILFFFVLIHRGGRAIFVLTV